MSRLVPDGALTSSAGVSPTKGADGTIADALSRTSTYQLDGGYLPEGYGLITKEIAPDGSLSQSWAYLGIVPNHTDYDGNTTLYGFDTNGQFAQQTWVMAVADQFGGDWGERVAQFDEGRCDECRCLSDSVGTSSEQQ